jgi:hypothetical protein
MIDPGESFSSPQSNDAWDALARSRREETGSRTGWLSIPADVLDEGRFADPGGPMKHVESTSLCMFWSKIRRAVA